MAPPEKAQHEVDNLPSAEKVNERSTNKWSICTKLPHAGALDSFDYPFELQQQERGQGHILENNR